MEMWYICAELEMWVLTEELSFVCLFFNSLIGLLATILSSADLFFLLWQM